MLFSLSSEHLDFFGKHQYIEFENLISLQETEELKLALDLALAKRLKTTPEKLDTKNSTDLFLHARNLWRDDALVKKVVLKTKLSEIAGGLFKKSPLRLAYDHYLRTGLYPESPFTENLSLQEISCYHPILGGLVLRLSEETAEPSAMNYSPLPKRIGSGIFVGPNLRLALTSLFKIPRLKLFLIVFCADRTLYALEKNDLLTHALKKEGFAFGDPLKGEMNPIVFRKS